MVWTTGLFSTKILCSCFYHKKFKSDIVIYMSEQNPDWSDTMEGHVVNFIIHTALGLKYGCQIVIISSEVLAMPYIACSHHPTLTTS